MNTIKAGDKIRTRGYGGVDHYGIYIGYQWGYGHCVAHNAKGIGVHVTAWDDFASGNEVFIDQEAPDDPAAQQAIVNRALSLRGKRYDLAFFNCEHFASYAQTGIPLSKQVIGICLFALTAMVVGRKLAG